MAAAMKRLGAALRSRVRRRPPRAVYTDPLRAAMEKAVTGTTSQALPYGITSGAILEQGIWMPVVRPEGLVLLTDLVWPIGASVDRVVEEATKGGYDFEGRFQSKCLACGSEYDVEPELCEGEGCFSTEFRNPDPDQLEGGPWKDGGIKGLLERPNWDDVTGHVVRTTLDLLKDGVYYANVIGGWHWEVIKDARGRPRQIWSMNSESMRPVEDPSLTMGTWFCPAHREVARTNDDIQQAFQEAGEDEEHPLCRTHAVPLRHTAWVQLGEGDEIVAIFAADEVLSDQPRARGYRIFARSKVLRVWAMGQTFRWQERYDLATFSGQRAPDLLVVVGGKKQSEVNASIQKWSQFVKANPEYQGVIWIGLGPGESPIEVKTINLLGDMTKRDFVAWQEHAFKSMAYNLGVAPVMMGVETAGKLGQPQEVLEVSYHTIEENQSQQEEFVNGQLVPLFAEVTDWKFVMKPPAPADEAQRAREAISWATAVERLRAAGADARLDPQAPFDWPILIEGWEARPETPQPGEGQPPGGEGEGGGAPGPFQMSLIQKGLIRKGWTAFTTATGTTGAVNSQGRKVYGEEARRVLAGKEPTRGDEEGKPRGPSEEERRSFIDGLNTIHAEFRQGGASEEEALEVMFDEAETVAERLREQGVDVSPEEIRKEIRELQEIQGEIRKFEEVDEDPPDPAIKDYSKLSDSWAGDRVVVLPSSQGGIGENNWPQDRLKAWLTNVPQAHRKYIAKITLTPKAREGLAGEARNGGGIELFPTTWEHPGRMNPEINFGEEVIYHEVGHQVANGIFGKMDPLQAVSSRFWFANIKDPLLASEEDLIGVDKRFWENNLLEEQQMWVERMQSAAVNLGLRTQEERRDSFTRESFDQVEEAVRMDFEKIYGVTWEEAMESVAIRQDKLPATGRWIMALYDALQIEHTNRMITAKSPEAWDDQTKLAWSYVQAAREDGRYPSVYAESKAVVMTTETRNPEFAENFAESYAGWLSDSERFKKSTPARMAWFVKQFGEPPSERKGSGPPAGF